MNENMQTNHGRDGISLGGFGSDVFGEVATGRHDYVDKANDGMRLELFRDYLQWHTQNHKFYDGYHEDAKKVQTLKTQKYFWLAAGVAFAGIVINPNFTMRRSIYMRKINPIVLGTVGWQWGKKKEGDHIVNMMLRMNDYLPFEVRRCVETKDFRYLQTFDYNNAKFDPVTGKSLT